MKRSCQHQGNAPSGKAPVIAAVDRNSYHGLVATWTVDVAPVERKSIKFGLGESFAFSQLRGTKLYELSDHLGNVAVVVSDRKLAQDPDADLAVDWFASEVLSARDFYPGACPERQRSRRRFVMPEREFSTGSYRYGFQGQETDDEFAGSENAVSYMYRVHDPRLGRFLSVDPLAPDYPWNSGYAFSENRVVDGVELEGLEYVRSADAVLYTVNGVIAWNYENLSGPSKAILEGKPHILNKIQLKYQWFDKGDEGDYAMENSKVLSGQSESVTLRKYGKVKKKYKTHKTKHGKIRVGYESQKVKKYNYRLANKGPVSKTMVGVEAAKTMVKMISWLMVEKDRRNAQKQMDLMHLAYFDFHNAAIQGFIPAEFLNDDMHQSNIVNVIFSGEPSNPSSDSNINEYHFNIRGEDIKLNAEEYRKIITDLGMRIYNNDTSETYNLEKEIAELKQ